MFFVFSKVLYFLILPFTWACVLLVLAFFFKKEKVRKRLIVASALVLLIFSNKLLLQKVVKWWEIPMTRENGLQPVYEYGIVLGGMSAYFFDEQRLVFDKSSDRLWQAYRLYQTGRIKKLVITGGSGSFFAPAMKEALFLKKYLLSIGLPEKDLFIESDSKNTYENANNTAIQIPETKKQRALLITSAWHMRRAAACFKKAGFSFDKYTTDTQLYHVLGVEGYIIPSSEALTTWGILIKEMIGYVVYRVAGYA